MNRVLWSHQFPRALLAASLLASCAGSPRTHAQPGLVRSEAARLLATEVASKGWIVFGTRSEAGDWDLAACRPDGSHVRWLTQTPDFHEFSPQASRDGRQLLYRRVPRSDTIDGNRHGEQGELVLANLDGSAPRPLGKPGELPWACWGPDGQQVATLSRQGIAFFDVATRTVVRTLPRQGFFQQVVWSPDGRWLCGVANAFGTGWSVARMDVTTGQASAVNKVDCCTPDWFPDSQRVIFSWRPPGQKGNDGQGWTQLWQADADGNTRQLVYGEDGRHVYGGHVSPDGRYVVFTGNMREDGDPANAGAPMGLMRLSDAPIIGGPSQELRALHPGAKDGPALTLPVGWEPCWTFNEALASADAAPDPPRGEVVQLASDLREKGWLVFSAWTDHGDWDLFLMRPDGSERRHLTDTRDFNEAGARFSPDGTRLLFYRMARSEPVDNNTYGTFDLVLANADGSAPVLYGPGFPWASWGPDGRQIACLAPKGVQIVDLATRAVLRVFPRKGIVSQLVWSPDGKLFTGTANGLGPFWNIGCLNPDTGEIKAVSETERYNCTSDWTPDSRRVVYARGIIPEKGGLAELWMANTDGTGGQRLYAETGRHIYGACASPDGKHVLFTRSAEDLGQVAQIEMAIIRWPEAAESARPNPVPRLDLGPGWEPHWTAKEIGK